MDNHSGSYDDIIDLPHHVSTVHPAMSMHNRAAQFSPFAALTGHGDCINETARLTGERRELTEDKSRDLNNAVARLTDLAPERPTVTVEYFIPDEKKSGGRYETFTGQFRRIDEYNRTLVFTDGTVIPMDEADNIMIHENKGQGE